MTRNAAFLSALSLNSETPQQLQGSEFEFDLSAHPKDVSGSPDPARTVSFIRVKSLNPDLKSRVGVCLLNLRSWS